MEAVVVAAVGALAFLWRGKRVVTSFKAAVRLCVELSLERGQLLRDAEEASNFHTQDYPNHICHEKETGIIVQCTVSTFVCRTE